MALISLSVEDTPYSSDIYTGGMKIEIKEAFLGVRFVTEDDHILSVSMRDGGFEVHYFSEVEGAKGFDTGWTYFKEGFVTPYAAHSVTQASQVKLDDLDKKDKTIVSDETKLDAKRQAVWTIAEDLASKIVSQHGIESYKTGPVFGVTSIMTKAEQHVELICDIANWLLGEE